MTAGDLASLRDRVARARIERDRERRGTVADRSGEVRPTAIRYDTPEERQQARRRSWNNSKKRIHGTCPKCKGAKAASPNVAMCRSCWSRVRVGEIERD